jgi:hypothetical protein
VFEEEGVDGLEIADRDPNARISRITGRLRPKLGHVHPDGYVDDQTSDYSSGAPTLYVFRDCGKLVDYIPQYRWRPQRTNFTEEDAPEVPRKKDDHNIDNLGHILVAMGDSTPEVPDNSKPLSAEQRELDEHFESELRRATVRAAHNGIAGRPLPTEAELAGVR